MAVTKQNLSPQIDPELLTAMQAIADQEGQPFQTVLEQAMREFIERKNSAKPREHVMSAYRQSVSRHNRLGELLAK